VWTFVLPPPFESPYAWPFAIVAAEIGFVAGLFGRFGLFRSRPQASTARLVGGIVVAFGLLGALGFWGILPYYRDLCGDGSSGGLCFQLIAPAASVDPALAVLAYVALAVLALGAIGLLLRLVRSRDLGAAFVLVGGATCGVLSALIAYPIAALLGGVSGSGTDLLVAAFQQAGSDLEHAVLQQSLISDPIDKAMTYLIVFLVLGSVSRRVTARFPQGERALGVAADETAARPVPDSRPLEA
jgi:hypothetical protein